MFMKGCLFLLLAITLCHSWQIGRLCRAFGTATAAVGLGLGLGLPEQAMAGSRTVAEIPTSGFVFKDKLKIESIEDPQLPGVAVFLADFERPLTEKIGGDFFDDPTSSSLTCVQTGPISKEALDKIKVGGEGEEIYSESKALLFKSVKVKRVKDSNGALIYSSFSSKADKGKDANKSRFKASICAIAPRF